MTPSNTLLQPVLIDESFHTQPVIPTNLCYKCGKAGHTKVTCQAVVRCRYALCRDTGKDSLHDTYVCPELMARCKYCQLRGHKRGDACQNTRPQLVAAFEEAADGHVLCRWRRAWYNWGIHIFPNRASVVAVQGEYTYEDVAKLSRRKFKELL